MTYKEATQTKVFVFDFNGDIVETTYAEHVLQSREECTHHTGVMPCLSVEELDHDWNSIEEDSDFSQPRWAVVSRNSYQRGFKIEIEFETEDEANDYWFSQIEKYDFAKDDQRSTEFFDTWAEAAQALAERELY